MYFIAIFGLLLAGFCLYMIVRPQMFADNIIRFGQKPWFHYFEIISRFLAGSLFIYFAEQTLYPIIFKIIGYVMVAVSIGLLIIGEDRHKYFAIWSANTFRNKFRWIGMLTIPFAIFLIYIALGQSILHFT